MISKAAGREANSQMRLKNTLPFVCKRRCCILSCNEVTERDPGQCIRAQAEEPEAHSSLMLSVMTRGCMTAHQEAHREGVRQLCTACTLQAALASCVSDPLLL